MKTTSSMVMWLGLLVVVLIVATFWSAHRLHESRTSASQAITDTQACAELAGAMISLRGDDVLASPEDNDKLEWAGMVQQTAETVGWSTDENLHVINPLPPQRIARTNQERRRVQIRLRRLELGQAVHLLHELTLLHPGLRVENIYLTSPEGHGPQAKWNLEPVVLSYRAQAANDQ